ncbi:hypothetical protein ACTJKQ_04055 [Acidovorax sp. 22279]|uniref:hypothetical protein n=1 Tax=Acidovorax sp. 22279 TaxID=3453900 RepID=UPI003F841C86
MKNSKIPRERSVSAEFIRQVLSKADKFEQKKELLGKLFAIQDVREIRRLHTTFPGQRAEFDFTKNGIFLYPNSKWNEPVLYVDGIGCDHASRAIGSLTTAMSSTSRDVVRLFRRYVMPKSTWLPSSQQSLAQRWDVFGIPCLVAVDNGADFVSNNAISMFLFAGCIMLRIPPRRGDLKGSVERAQGTMETRYISHLPGYVARQHVGLNPKYTKVRERAKAAATMTLAEYEALRASHAVEYNEEFHPRLKKRRIDVFRDGQEMAPLLLLTDTVQQRLTFGLTYYVKLTREGVEVETLKFNSAELHDAYLTYSGNVYVKLDPDDVRTVLVLIPQIWKPIEATLTTFTYVDAVSLELYQHIRNIHDAEAKAASTQPENIPFAFDSKLQEVQHSAMPSSQGTVKHKQIQAATHAAAMPAAQPTNTMAQDLASLLAGTRLSNEK